MVDVPLPTKGCPFCGGVCHTGKNLSKYSPNDRETRNDLLYAATYGFGCATCDVYLMVDAVNNDPFSHETMLKAREAWDTRNLIQGEEL
tara:strand:+ start:1265 stop:1531 length:267 start_codon:yes stop_codon:yes gene_type:complete